MLRWIVAALGVLAVSLAVASSGLKPAVKGQREAERGVAVMDSADTRLRRNVSFKREQWSRVLVDAATAAGSSVAELNNRPEAFLSATYTGDAAQLVGTLAQLEERGAPLKRAWFGPAAASPDSLAGSMASVGVTVFRLLVELERPDTRR